MKPLWYWPAMAIVYPTALVLGLAIAVMALGLGGAIAVMALGTGVVLSPWMMTRHGQKKLAATQKYLADKARKYRE